MPTQSEKSTIFIVEDNPADVFLVQEALRANHLASHVEVFNTGESAIAALSILVTEPARTLPNLVLLDWNLPLINGAEVLRTLRQWPHLSSMPIAVLTSSGSSRDRSEALDLGANRFIQKPMNLDDFIGKVGEQIRELLEPKAQSAP